MNCFIVWSRSIEQMSFLSITFPRLIHFNIMILCEVEMSILSRCFFLEWRDSRWRHNWCKKLFRFKGFCWISIMCMVDSYAGEEIHISNFRMCWDVYSIQYTIARHNYKAPFLKQTLVYFTCSHSFFGIDPSTHHCLWGEVWHTASSYKIH